MFIEELWVTGGRTQSPTSPAAFLTSTGRPTKHQTYPRDFFPCKSSLNDRSMEREWLQLGHTIRRQVSQAQKHKGSTVSLTNRAEIKQINTQGKHK
jgi:hypothetical protein